MQPSAATVWPVKSGCPAGDEGLSVDAGALLGVTHTRGLKDLPPLTSSGPSDPARVVWGEERDHLGDADGR
jgi:hypothetical protein